MIKSSASNTGELSVWHVCKEIENKVMKLKDKYDAAQNAEMTAFEYLKAKARMTENCSRDCNGCILSFDNNGEKILCSEFETKYPERVISIVQQWSKEHPKKTILQDFLEKHPNAMLTEYGDPFEICLYYLGYEKEPDNDNELCNLLENDSCKKCWDRPLGEVN